MDNWFTSIDVAEKLRDNFQLSLEPLRKTKDRYQKNSSPKDRKNQAYLVLQRYDHRFLYFREKQPSDSSFNYPS